MNNRDLHAVWAPLLFLAAASKTAAAYNSLSVDTMAALTTSDLRENLTNMMILLNITFGTSGTVDIIVQDSADNLVFANFATLSQAADADGETLYSAEIKDFRRYVRLNYVVAVDTSLMSLTGVGDRSRREPVVNGGTRLTTTYA